MMRHREALAYIAANLRRMKVGDLMNVEPEVLAAAYPPRHYNGAQWTSMDVFMDSQVGSSYGAWKIWKNIDPPHYVIARGEIGEERVWTSPDRR